MHVFSGRSRGRGELLVPHQRVILDLLTGLCEVWRTERSEKGSWRGVRGEQKGGEGRCKDGEQCRNAWLKGVSSVRCAWMSK